MPGWVAHQVSGRGMLIAARREASRETSPGARRRDLASLMPATARHHNHHAQPPHSLPAASPHLPAACRQPARSLPQAHGSPGAGTETIQWRGQVLPPPGEKDRPRRRPRLRRGRRHRRGRSKTHGRRRDRHRSRPRARRRCPGRRRSGVAVERMAALAGAELPTRATRAFADGLTGTIDQNTRSLVRRPAAWEDGSDRQVQTTSDARELRELQRSGSPPAPPPSRPLMRRARDTRDARRTLPAPRGRLAGDLADQIRTGPPTTERRHAAAMLVVATQITELAAIAADHLRHRNRRDPCPIPGARGLQRPQDRNPARRAPRREPLPLPARARLRRLSPARRHRRSAGSSSSTSTGNARDIRHATRSPRATPAATRSPGSPAAGWSATTPATGRRSPMRPTTKSSTAGAAGTPTGRCG